MTIYELFAVIFGFCPMIIGVVVITACYDYRCQRRVRQLQDKQIEVYNTLIEAIKEC